MLKSTTPNFHLPMNTRFFYVIKSLYHLECVMGRNCSYRVRKKVIWGKIFLLREALANDHRCLYMTRNGPIDTPEGNYTISINALFY
ncbi:hypothetical protein XELAEV_18013564mg [Xenopus laevis]|uniref:Uncharacterized protein n=1 Tax=Xenopus laevis TaxID=8355 RepID=A0A974DPT8_XENLA|nr:hypothetical protein XELAEV_18013564mg [Xenopus laevis]